MNYERLVPLFFSNTINTSVRQVPVDKQRTGLRILDTSSKNQPNYSKKSQFLTKNRINHTSLVEV